jgi:hypothetical protein
MFEVMSHAQPFVGAAVSAAAIAQLGGQTTGNAGALGISIGAAIAVAALLALIRIAWKSGMDRATRGADATSAISAHSEWWFGK